MNGSLVMAKIAGTESIAKTTSRNSTDTRARNRGVANQTDRTPSGSLSLMKKRAPWNSSVTRNRERTKRSAALVDRKSVVEGKSVSVRVDLGGWRIFKKKNKNRSCKNRIRKAQYQENR